jgi:hypothetical protein
LDAIFTDLLMLKRPMSWLYNYQLLYIQEFSDCFTTTFIDCGNCDFIDSWWHLSFGPSQGPISGSSQLGGTQKSAIHGGFLIKRCADHSTKNKD